jgi:hypothetical protein
MRLISWTLQSGSEQFVTKVSCSICPTIYIVCEQDALLDIPNNIHGL